MSFNFDDANTQEKFMTLCGLIKNNGFFKSEKQAKFLTRQYDIRPDTVYEQLCGSTLTVQVGQRVIICDAFCRWADYGSRSVIPLSFLFLVDSTGVLARYKLPYNGNLRDGAAPDWSRLQIQWSRPADAVVPEYLVTKAPEVVEKTTPQSLSEFICEGKVGVRVQLKGVVKNIRTFESSSRHSYYDSGMRTVTTVVCGNDVVTYFNQLGDAEVGDEVEFSAALKDWKIYNNCKQTVVGRATKIVVKKVAVA